MILVNDQIKKFSMLRSMYVVAELNTNNKSLKRKTIKFKLRIKQRFYKQFLWQTIIIMIEIRDFKLQY